MRSMSFYCVRIREKGFLKDKGRNLLVTPDGAHNAGGRSKKGDNLHKRNNYSSNGAKYMSYVKVGVHLVILKQ